MTSMNSFAAELLKRSAGGYAGAAASLLLEKEKELAVQAGALDVWKAHLTQRVLELAAALEVGEHSLFAERLIWSRKTFVARDQDPRILTSSVIALREVLAESLPSNAKGAAQQYIDEAISALQTRAVLSDESQLDPASPNGKMALNYLRGVLEGNGSDAVGAIVESVAKGMSAETAYLDVLLPAQKEIGRLWHASQVTVAEEHLVTGCTQRAMALLTHTAPRSPENGATIVAACVAGNAHDIAVRALADLFYLSGWRSIFLGADVPIMDLPGVLDTYNANMLLLSGTLSTQVGLARQAIENVRENSDRSIKIVVGGAAFDEVPELGLRLGADDYAATAREALQLGAKYLKAR